MAVELELQLSKFLLVKIGFLKITGVKIKFGFIVPEFCSLLYILTSDKCGTITNLKANFS